MFIKYIWLKYIIKYEYNNFKWFWYLFNIMTRVIDILSMAWVDFNIRGYSLRPHLHRKWLRPVACSWRVRSTDHCGQRILFWKEPIRTVSGPFDFITLARTGLKWIKAEIDAHFMELVRLSRTCPFDATTHGITVTLMRDFVKVRKYGNNKTGAVQGEEETFSHRDYLHIFHNATWKVD